MDGASRASGQDMHDAARLKRILELLQVDGLAVGGESGKWALGLFWKGAAQHGERILCCCVVLAKGLLSCLLSRSLRRCPALLRGTSLIFGVEAGYAMARPVVVYYVCRVMKHGPNVDSLILPKRLTEHGAMMKSKVWQECFDVSTFQQQGRRPYMMLWRTVWDAVKLKCGTCLPATYR